MPAIARVARSKKVPPRKRMATASREGSSANANKASVVSPELIPRRTEGELVAHAHHLRTLEHMPRADQRTDGLTSEKPFKPSRPVRPPGLAARLRVERVSAASDCPSIRVVTQETSDEYLK